MLLNRGPNDGLAFALGLRLSRRPIKNPISLRLLAMLLNRGPNDGLAFALVLSLSRRPTKKTNEDSGRYLTGAQTMDLPSACGPA